MGIDSVIYVEGTATDEHLAAAEAYMQARVDYLAWRGQPDGPAPILVRQDCPEPRIEVSTGTRFYGPGYERGPWPQIYGGIRAMQGAFPDRAVYYGGDSSDYGRECTPEFLESLWQHWLGPDGDAYHRR